MKISKKAISFIMAIMIVFSAVAVTSVSTSALTVYNPEIMYTYDSTLRDYSYGTGVGANWPKQVSYNDNGWMRWQSVDSQGVDTFALQWQWHGYVTPEFNEQFKAGIANVNSDEGCGTMNLTLFLKSASVINPNQNTVNGNARVQIEANCALKCITFDDTEVTESLHLGNYDEKQGDYWTGKIPTGKLLDYKSFELTSVSINIQNYDFGWDQNAEGNRGLGNLDIYISPFYASDATMPEMGDASDYDPEFNEADWAFQNPTSGVGVFNKDDLVRQEGTKYPQKANGDYYTPVPKKMLTVIEPPAKIENVKATASGTSANISWGADKFAVKYSVVEASNQVAAKTVTGTSTTITGLTPGKTYTFKVRGANENNKYGPYSNTVSVKIAGGVTLSGASSVKAGATIKLSANKSVKWTTSNKAVATVTSAGVVKGIMKGSVTITATDASGLKASKKISVAASISKIKLNKAKATLKKGKSLTLKATVNPTYAKRLIAWKTSKAKVVKVTNGKLKAVKKGTATITCYAKDGSGKKATCKVTVK